jgi:rubrerythrin
MKSAPASEEARDLKALKTAIEAEKKSLDTYLGFALRTDDVSGKNMFIRLASDEFEHMNILERQTLSLKETGDWLSVEVERSEVEAVVPHLEDKDLKIRGTRGQDQVSALHVALNLEKKAAEFYRTQARKAPDNKARQMYGRLTAMEEAHYELLQAEIDNIARTGFWFGLREFSLEIE